jgi:hypothetical protein
LEAVPEITHQDNRAINCEMAAEWRKLADDIVELSKPIEKTVGRLR